MQKKLTTIEEEKKALPPPQAHGYTPEQIEQGLKLLKEQDAEIKRRKAIQEEDKKELKSEKKKRAATAMERRKLERERLEEENKRIKGIMQTTYNEEIKKKGGGFNKLRKLASDKNVNPGANPSEKQLIDALLAKNANLSARMILRLPSISNITLILRKFRRN